MLSHTSSFGSMRNRGCVHATCAPNAIGWAVASRLEEQGFIKLDASRDKTRLDSPQLSGSLPLQIQRIVEVKHVVNVPSS